MTFHFENLSMNIIHYVSQFYDIHYENIFSVQHLNFFDLCY